MAATTIAFEQELLQSALGDPTNLAPNPTGETGITFPVFTTSTGGQPAASAVDTTAWSRAGTHATRYTVTKADATLFSLRTPLGTSGIPVIAGHWYALRLTIHIESITGAAAMTSCRGSLQWFNAAGSAASVVQQQGTLVSPPPVAGQVNDLTVNALAPADAAYAALAINSVLPGSAGTPVTLVIDADAAMLVDVGTEAPPSIQTTTQPGDVPSYFDGSYPGCAWSGAANNSASKTWRSVANPGRGLMAGAAYKLRQNYLAGMTDPAAHTNAKNHPKQLKALTDNAKLASFDAITAP